MGRLSFLRKGRFNLFNKRKEKSSVSFATPDYAGVMHAQYGPGGKIINLNGENRARRKRQVKRAMAKRGIKVGDKKIVLEKSK